MTDILHQISFGMMIVAAFVATIISVERIIFSAMNMRRAKTLVQKMDQDGFLALDQHLGTDTVSDMVRHLLNDLKRTDISASLRENRADAAYLHACDELSARLWILDTVVTAAPLMGLLGTIFGIVDTFLALSKSGMSDPSAVSAGIGTALYATALGISIALIGIMAFNFLNDRNERISERLKMLILKLAA